MAARLTDLQIRNATPRGKAYKLTAARGLCVMVMPNGAKYWRMRYRYGGKEKMLALGVYPQVGIRNAEQQADEARALLLSGTDPAEHRRQSKLQLRAKVARTFGQAAEAWFDFKSQRWREPTRLKARMYLDKDLLPPLSRRPITNITPVELTVVVERIEKRGAHNVAKKSRQWLHSIFDHAIATGLLEGTNPAQYLSAVAAPAPQTNHHAHLTLKELPDFLSKLDAYPDTSIPKAACKLALWTANRPGVTRTLLWSELDLDEGLWAIPKDRPGMKRGYAHVTPLPRQAIAMLRDLHAFTGHSVYVFPGRNDPRKPLSDGGVNVMLRKIGYAGRQTAHGFRHLISTALNERDYNPDWVERQLAHGDPDEIRGTYNKAHYLEQRRQMMQDWADLLDEIRGSGKPRP
ncbi:integrase arm-type DNA-binding domain-containing protein [Oleiagrimonas sp. C23AA]|uniref:tyrosine-type recombinase/integrase n=1 Tax=Oleiagrimonas sp. C23AA TaxID=2719047 RepID=UPI0014224C15|nr:integrase arm-type DNA-binding domain-containing protein [Oleiagrimonas sp. C23AA]NII11766.1 integrase arm-type DNA-binding domain-containing protein [Oleiagrimonas sp. C23AA]